VASHALFTSGIVEKNVVNLFAEMASTWNTNVFRGRYFKVSNNYINLICFLLLPFNLPLTLHATVSGSESCNTEVSINDNKYFILCELIIFEKFVFIITSFTRLPSHQNFKTPNFAVEFCFVVHIFSVILL
jgi:hypothetical protein